MDNDTISETTANDIITTRGSTVLRSSRMTNAMISTTNRQEPMSTTPIQITSPSFTFSSTIVALMVCIPLAVLTIIIVGVCICIRRGASRQGSETYEDFSKVDQSAMMRMSMYNALDDERAANESDLKSPDHPEENGHTIKDTDKEQQILKDSFDIQNDRNKSSDESVTNEENKDLIHNSQDIINMDINTSKEKKGEIDDKERNNAMESKELEKTESAFENSNNTDDVHLRKHINLQSEISSTSAGSKAKSGDYYTLKANFIPLPE